MSKLSVIQVSKFPNVQKFEIGVEDVIPNATLYFQCKVPMTRDRAMELMNRIIESLKNVEVDPELVKED